MEINEHLGKGSSSYKQTSEVDPSLLVKVLRSENRNSESIDASTFVGVDVWNCYEFSTLMPKGFPITGWLKIIYPSNSYFIVESKSLKLYLNSFNMANPLQINGHYSLYTFFIQDIVKLIKDDLSNFLETEVFVSFIDKWHNVFTNSGTLGKASNITDDLTGFIDLDKIIVDFPWTEIPEVTTYNVDPSVLKLVRKNRILSNSLEVNEYLSKKQYFKSSSLRSNCKITNQPDWGDVYIYIDAPPIQKTSLFEYIVSFRNENHFHEEICEKIYSDLKLYCKPRELLVACNYTRRGGIDINPIRASSYGLIEEEMSKFISIDNIEKTFRQ